MDGQIQTANEALLGGTRVFISGKVLNMREHDIKDNAWNREPENQ